MRGGFAVVGHGVVNPQNPGGQVNSNFRVAVDLYARRKSSGRAVAETKYPGNPRKVPQVEEHTLAFRSARRQLVYEDASSKVAPEIFTDFCLYADYMPPVFACVPATKAASTGPGVGGVAGTHAGVVNINHRGPLDIHFGDIVYWIMPYLGEKMGACVRNAVEIVGMNKDLIHAGVVGFAPGTPISDIVRRMAEYDPTLSWLTKELPAERRAIMEEQEYEVIDGAAGALDEAAWVGVQMAEILGRKLGTALSTTSPGGGLVLALCN